MSGKKKRQPSSRRTRAATLNGLPIEQQFANIFETAARGNFIEARHLLKVFASTNIPATKSAKSERQMLVDLLAIHITHERRIRQLERDISRMASAFETKEQE